MLMFGQYVLIVLFSQIHCHDFNQQYWNDYSVTMMNEWGLHTSAICVNNPTPQQRTDMLATFRQYHTNVIELTYDSINHNVFPNAINENQIGVRGISFPTNYYGMVKYIGFDTSEVVSHESLHMTLYDMGYHNKSCYVDAVHSHADLFHRGKDGLLVVEQFDC